MTRPVSALTRSSRHELHPVLLAAADAAQRTYLHARAAHSRAELEAVIGIGADGTPTMYIDDLVETAILEVSAAHGVNVLSEEAGFIDHGSALTLVIDPLDGSANAAAGVPLACFSAALAEENHFTQALTRWLDGNRQWAAAHGTTVGPEPLRTTGRSDLSGAALSLLRPQTANRSAWDRLSRQAGRVRVLSCSTLESALVLTGAVDAFADPGGDVHRLVDLAAAVVLADVAGGCVLDAHDRPIELDLDLTHRWSGIVAATSELAHAVQAQIAG
ncbi:inositol monophosphatase family protein [Nocardia africana]|uniref:inositol-phosphate phosphatase n=1 Tax=Nocardia africana TaxID=134964 RepID=A0ABW6NRR1_9NOCA